MQLLRGNGKTPDGRRFELCRCVDNQGNTLYARLEWLADEDQGAIGIPLKTSAPFAGILHELRTAGNLSKETLRASVAL